MPMAVTTGGRGGRGASTPVTVVVKTKDGREIRGVRRNEDTFSLQMTDASGNLRLLDKQTLASVTIESASLHPPDYSTRLSGSDISNLVAYCQRSAAGWAKRARRRFLEA